jgi:hypothetical protein
MTVLTMQASAHFRLEPGRLADHLLAQDIEPCGIDGAHEGGFAAAITARFEDAREAGAILAPPGVEAHIYPLGYEALILAVRETQLPPTARWPLRQVATFAFDPGEVAGFGDESFEACCTALRELLRRAEALLPALAAVGAAEGHAA